MLVWLGGLVGPSCDVRCTAFGMYTHFSFCGKAVVERWNFPKTLSSSMLWLFLQQKVRPPPLSFEVMDKGISTKGGKERKEEEDATDVRSLRHCCLYTERKRGLRGERETHFHFGTDSPNLSSLLGSAFLPRFLRNWQILVCPLWQRDPWVGTVMRIQLSELQAISNFPRFSKWGGRERE